MARPPQLRYVVDEQPAEHDVLDALPEGEDHHSEWNEAFSQDEEGSALPVHLLSPANTFAYAVGHRVQPAPTAPARTIVWRGQVREHRPDTGRVHRVNVYRLNDGFWDCDREDELPAA
ncbi:MAG TPA: hypothetical protein VF690_18795 [Hymenobacter sp.]|jgi:hypothetical protein